MGEQKEVGRGEWEDLTPPLPTSHSPPPPLPSSTSLLLLEVVRGGVKCQSKLTEEEV